MKTAVGNGKMMVGGLILLGVGLYLLYRHHDLEGYKFVGAGLSAWGAGHKLERLIVLLGSKP